MSTILKPLQLRIFHTKKIQKTLGLVLEASNKMAPIFRPITFKPLSWTQTSPLVAIKLPSEVHLQFQKVKKKIVLYGKLCKFVLVFILLFLNVSQPAAINADRATYVFHTYILTLKTYLKKKKIKLMIFCQSSCAKLCETGISFSNLPKILF